MKEQQKARVIKYIEAAFVGVKQPDKLTLHVAEAHDSYDYDHDEEHHKKDYIGPWLDIPAEHFANCQSALFQLDAEGLRYYLPGFMIWHLKNFDQAGVPIIDSVLFALNVDPKDNKRFALFNKEQLNACFLFVKYLVDCGGANTDQVVAQRMLEHYWHKYD